MVTGPIIRVQIRACYDPLRPWDGVRIPLKALRRDASDALHSHLHARIEGWLTAAYAIRSPPNSASSGRKHTVAAKVTAVA